MGDMWQRLSAWWHSIVDHLRHVHPPDVAADPPVDLAPIDPLVSEPVKSPVDMGGQGSGVGPPTAIAGQSADIRDLVDDDGNLR